MATSVLTNGHANSLTNGHTSEHTNLTNGHTTTKSNTQEKSNSSEKIANLAVIDYEALADKSPAEVAKLVEAASTEGMFYLDLRGPRTRAALDDVPSLFRASHDFFTLPPDSEDKEKTRREGVERGYHATKGFEYYEMARDDFELGRLELPSSLISQKERITRTIKAFNGAVQTILAELCAAYNISVPELADDPTIPCDTALKLVYKPPIHDAGKVIHPWHTDFGLATLLWYDEVTTQVAEYDASGKQTDGFRTVPVIEGTVLINVADNLAAASGGRLHSTVHRVVAPPGEKRVRNGVIYLLRPYKTE